MRESRLSWVLNILAGMVLLMGGIAAAEAITRAVAPGSPFVRIPALVIMLTPALLFAEYRNHGAFSGSTIKRIALMSLLYLALLAVGMALGVMDFGATVILALPFLHTHDRSRRWNPPVVTREGSHP